MKLRWIEPHEPLPPPARALREPNGLLAAGRDLSPERLLEAYRHGIFPWFSDGQPVLWWSPDPRMVLDLDDFVVTRSFAKTLRRIRREGRWQLRLDTAFDAVMRECAAPREGQDGTWITDDICAAYGGLHRMGLAHSVETWSGDTLIGGLYGVSLGRMFFGESMFAREPEASKVALAGLVNLLRRCDFSVIDCQQNTSHLASMGAHETDRRSFLRRVDELIVKPPPDWSTLQIELPDA
ncbi:MAG TPA: leucyl/phenylalanyl-tRNA--protein transferase [Burkholderiaceae bacterium]|nr:leucyl/phenylalanyl-tRNA--protein transferase [Burkholderiaceae bacterium]